jgi:uncharacterized protein involved in exopolysaccharide biosynthesis
MGDTSGILDESRRKGILVFVPDAELDQELSWSAFARSVWADRLIHGLVTFACLVVAALLAFVPTPVFRAQAVLLPVSNSPQSQLTSGLQAGGLASLAGLAGINLDGFDDFKKESLALLTSRNFTAQFIEEENLLPIFFAKKWDAARGRWRTDNPQEEPSIDDGLEFFDKHVRFVTEDKRNGLTMVAIEWTDRSLAAKWANDLVARANAELRRRTIQNAQHSLEFLRRELGTTTISELQQTLYRLMESELRKNMLAAVREDYAFRVIDTARVPSKKRRVWPQRTLIFSVAIGAALVLNAAIARVRSRSRRLVSSAPPK